MLDDKIKMAQLIADLNASQSEPGMRHLVKVLDAITEELRGDNDTAEDKALYRNQGEIRGYNRLKEYILRGLPTGSSEKSS
jgi:hypothetical protein